MPTLQHVKVAGEAVSYDKETASLCIAGETFTVDQWRELEHRINTLITGRVGNRKKENYGSSPLPSPQATGFVVNNLPALNAIKRGKVKNAPLILRPFYDSVITKEALNGTGTS